MKVVQVHTQAAAGGTQRVSDMVADGLSAGGHQVRIVFMYRYSDAYDGVENADILFRERAVSLLARGRGVLALIGYLRRSKPDAVITYDFWGNIFGALGAKVAGVPLVIANQSLAPATSGKLAVASFLDRLWGSIGLYSANVVNSRWTERQYFDYPPSYRQRLNYIEHGCWRPDTQLERKAARLRFELPLDVPLIVSVGRLSDLKNQAALVAALPLLPGVHLALAGNGPAREQIVRLAQEQGVTERLHLIGEVARDQVFDFLAAGDVFAFPSHSETFGLAAAEAAIAGIPVVANDLDVLRDVLTDDAGQPAALFADAAKPDALAAAITRLLDEPALIVHLQSAGRALAEKYDPARMAAAYAALLTGLR